VSSTIQLCDVNFEGAVLPEHIPQRLSEYLPMEIRPMYTSKDRCAFAAHQCYLAEAYFPLAIIRQDGERKDIEDERNDLERVLPGSAGNACRDAVMTLIQATPADSDAGRI
jgi:hypothetical protein